MEINNLDLILPYLEFDNEDQFYFIQIIKRKKENKNLLKDIRQVKTFHIKSRQELLDVFPEIQSLCKFHNARAYIDLNRKSFERTALIVLQKLSTCLIEKTYKSLKGVYDSACGSHNIETYPKWLIDLDVKNKDILNEVINEIEHCDSKFGQTVITTFPTLNGFHIITEKFNHKQLEPYQCDQQLDVHKYCTTLLYYEGTYGTE